MKIGIYSPYFHILGGGERYILTISEYLSHHHNVFLFSDKSIITKARDIFHIDLKRVSFLPIEKLRFSFFDVFFYMTDGSIFFPKAKKNFVIIQSPIHCPKKSLLNKLRLQNWHILCYSEFMQIIIKQRLGRVSDILSPGIDTDTFKAKENQKENIILTVGRFFSHLHNKKQHILVRFAKSLLTKLNSQGWKYIIAGGLTDVGGKAIVKDLKEESKGLPIDIIINPSFKELLTLYKKAKIYWHGAGYGEDLKKHPERAEHFGITTLEAMATGCVPIVFNGGGQRDIVENEKNGFLWEEPATLIDKTTKVISNDTLRIQLAEKAMIRAADFSLKHFYEKLETLITG